jgi:hypothetical protein
MGHLLWTAGQLLLLVEALEGAIDFPGNQGVSGFESPQLHSV